MTSPIRRRSVFERAFTLLEIMLVVAIIALLLGSAFFIFGDKLAIGQDARLKADFTAIGTALETYRMMADDQYPTTEQGLQALVTIPTADPKPSKWYRMMDKLPKDPWGRDYVYVYPGKHNPDKFDLYSRGKDGIDGTADDKGNWDSK
jgi:general secretion pathway protein G